LLPYSESPHDIPQDVHLPEIWSYGHRTVEGLAFHPETGKLWAHGGLRFARIEGTDHVERIVFKDGALLEVELVEGADPAE